jgi:hypothetical protein
MDFNVLKHPIRAGLFGAAAAADSKIELPTSQLGAQAREILDGVRTRGVRAADIPAAISLIERARAEASGEDHERIARALMRGLFVEHPFRAVIAVQMAALNAAGHGPDRREQFLGNAEGLKRRMFAATLPKEGSDT